jgi:HEXXH motif-containing protein
MMSDLVERVEIGLSNPGECPWLPELTTELVEAGWRDLYRKAGLSSDEYGTARALTRDVSVPCRIISRLPIFSGAVNPNGCLQVEILEAEFVRKYEDNGIRFYTADEIDAANILDRLREAISILKSIPTLFTTVASLVRSIHLLDPDDDDYDVSFSEPDLPFSIFVSVPQASSVTNALRVAEAIVHEAMHLQLTLIEGFLPLVIQTQKRIFSPWRAEYRTIRGVLHALYVFRVIDKFLECLLSIQNYSTEQLGYIQRRRDEIDEQINKIQAFQNRSELTIIGACFVEKLISN